MNSASEESGSNFEGSVEVVERFLGPPERVERDPVVDQRFRIDRVERERSLVRVERLVVAVEVVQQNPTPHPRVRRAGHLLQLSVDDAERIGQAGPCSK